MTVTKWLKNKTKSLSGKTVAISGATGGLGNALTRHLAALGADLILLDRNPTRSKALADTLGEDYPACRITRITVDMEDLATIKAATDVLLASVPDYLILNAGAYHIPRHKTACGYDNVFTINQISPYYMARKLKDAIANKGGRIVAVGSIAHNYSKTDPDDIDFSSRQKARLVYGNAKRRLMYALTELFKDSDTLAITHPGITFTGITSHYPKVIFAIIKHPMKVIFHSTKKASLSILDGIFRPTPHRSWTGPSLFGIWGSPKTRPLRTANEEEIAHIFKTAEEIFHEIERM